MHSLKLILLLIPVLILSCTTEGCYEEMDADLNISVRETDNEEANMIDSLTVYGVGLEDAKLYNLANTGSLKIPLFGGSSSVSYVVINGTVYDTVNILYSSKYNFVSQGCGYNYLHTINSVSFTKNRIDTILIINDQVTTSDEENLRTFF